MRKMHAAIVAAFSPDKARDIMEGVVSDLTSRIESARDATPKSDRLTKQFEKNARANEGFEDQLKAGLSWSNVVTVKE